MELNVDAQALLKTFMSMPDKVKLKVARQALRQGAVVVKKYAQANVRASESSEASGVLEKSIQVAKFKEQNGRVRYAVRIKPKSVNERKRDGQGKPVRVGLYAAVLNWGKANQKPWHWLTNAAKEHVPEVVAAARQGFQKNLDAAVKEAGGK